ncbi:MAG: hypothetical protein ACRD3E_05135 [Terriglobales bacterium]
MKRGFCKSKTLARAISIAGGKATPEQAAALFPVRWKRMQPAASGQPMLNNRLRRKTIS